MEIFACFGMTFNLLQLFSGIFITENESSDSPEFLMKIMELNEEVMLHGVIIFKQQIIVK